MNTNREQHLLKPCPFCGCSPVQYDNEYATCPSYPCVMNGLVIKNEKWNTRVPDLEHEKARAV